MAKKDTKDNKEIEVLEDWEHVLLRPQVYVSSVNMSEQKVPIIKGGKIVSETRTISVGFYKLLNEILDNAIDEAKRMKGRMPSITVSVDPGTNRCEVVDTGDGFYKGTAKNKKSGLSNIETAMSQLRAGSNFRNEETESSIVGQNGLGGALVNILSDEFVVDTQNSEDHFRMSWDKFKSKGPAISKGLKRQTGTTVSFVPRRGVFRGCSWDREMFHTMMLFKRFLIKNDPLLKALDFRANFGADVLDLDLSFLSDAHIVKGRLGVLAILPAFDESTSVSFVNSAMCTGIHQRIVNEFINAELDDPLGHHFYETFFVLNMPPRLVSFADQNKTRLDSKREDVQGTILDAFRGGLESMFSTPMFAAIRKKVEDRKMSTEVAKLRKAKKSNAGKVSTKYFPPTQRADNLWITEGESASGGILRARDVKTDGVFTLKGKIKNVRSVSDLSTNLEIIELMSVLDLDLDPAKRAFTFKRIIVASDADCDGGHIATLLTNLFFRWFPYIVNEGRLFRLQVPLLSTGDGKKREYYYGMQEYHGAKAPKSVRYLKGLGSLSIDDWEHVMQNKRLEQLSAGDDASEYLKMAFDTDSGPRKLWLQGKPF